MLRRLASWCDRHYEVGFECARSGESVPWRSSVARLFNRLGAWRLTA